MIFADGAGATIMSKKIMNLGGILITQNYNQSCSKRGTYIYFVQNHIDPQNLIH